MTHTEWSWCGGRRWRHASLATAALSAFLLVPPAALAQASAQGSSHAGTPRGQVAQGGKSTAVTRSMTDEDRELIEDIAHVNLAEIETGRLALEKTNNSQVRSFAQKMIDDHGNAQKELQQLGQRKGVEVPQETDFQHKALATALRLLSGDTFDNQYMRQVGMNDHRRTVDLLQKAQRTARDPDLKAYAGKTLPVVQRHLSMARQMASQNASAGGSADSRSMGAGPQQQNK